MTDSTLEVQKAIVGALKGDAAIVLLTGGRIYDQPPQQPTYPLIEIGPSFGDVWEGSDMDGWEVVMTVNVWSEKPGRVEASQIATAIKSAMHRAVLPLDTQQFVLGDVMGTNVIPQDDGRTTLAAIRLRFLTHDE